jgi:DNA invertase Pin-like site-specific DNA recombinase
MKPFAGVVRVSHMGKRKENAPDFHAKRDQVKAIREAAADLGVELKVLPAELSVSGGEPLERRPSMLAAVEGVERGGYEGIIVAYQSRIGRDVEIEEAIWRRVEHAGGRIIMALDGIDATTVDGKMVRRIRSAINHAERDRHAERFANLREWATAAGIWQRRQTPRGYLKHPATRKLVPDGPIEKDGLPAAGMGAAGEVRATFQRRSAGAAIIDLAHHLGMTPSGVRALLRNRVYLGELRVGPHVNPTAHPPLVTEDEFAAVQSVRTTRPARSSEPVALLAGLVRCGSCGHVMSRSTGKRRIYLCHVHHSAGPCPRPSAITLQSLDEYVTAIAVSELRKLSTRAAGRNGDLVHTRNAVRAAERELAAYLEGVQAAGLEPGQWAEGARRRREQFDAARHGHAELLSRKSVAVEGDPVKAWHEMDPAQRNRLLSSLIECVVVTPVGRGKRVPVKDRVRVVRHGTRLAERYGGGGVALPVRRLLWPDVDSPVVLRV